MEQTPAGWYADPWNGRKIRYWNGAEWTLYTGKAPVADSAAGTRWTAAALVLVAAGFVAILVQPFVLR